MFHIEKRESGHVLLLRVVSVLVALVAAGIFIALCGYGPLTVYGQMLAGSFGSEYYVRQMVQKMIPLLIMGLGVSVCFRMNFINIGAEGQFYIGAVAATYVALHAGSMPVALAILLDPEMKKNVKEILFMGGAVNVIGNDTPVASFNAAVDPEATHIVYHSGIPVVQLGLDICDQFTETDADFERRRAGGGAIGRYLFDMTRAWRQRDSMRRYSRWYKTREDGIGMNDVAATAYLINPDWFTCEDVACDIQLGGISAGQTVVDFRGWWNKEPNVRFAYQVDGRAAVEQWMADLIRYDHRQ